MHKSILSKLHVVKASQKNFKVCLMKYIPPNNVLHKGPEFFLKEVCHPASHPSPWITDTIVLLVIIQIAFIPCSAS